MIEPYTPTHNPAPAGFFFGASMTDTQRAALLGLCAAILACDCATPDMRFRAESLQFRMAFDASFFRSIFG